MLTKVPHAMTTGVASTSELNTHKAETATQSALGHVKMWLTDGTTLNISASATVESQEQEE